MLDLGEYMVDKQIYPCLFCGKSQSDANIVQGKINVIEDNINLIHSWPKDICMCNECVTAFKEILNKHKQE